MLSKLKNPDLGLFLVRLALALVFIAHGFGKFADIAGTTAFFGKIGLAPFFVYLVAAVEFVGGLAMLLGLFTAVAGVALALVMLFAIILVKGGKGFFGFELDLTLLLAALGVAMAGPGKYAVKWFQKPPAQV